ncbi:MAG: selenocysteine-specific translation elongation factor [Acidobacteriota bacterium]
MKDLIVGTAGHIDHGKTTLIRALTGIDTDRLEEEKRRGITIDIGFAHMYLGSHRVGFIDVPGHERFVKNMLAGIGGIHMVLLVVAADESVMPQTTEHFQICRLLGISRGIIVLTKKSLVEEELLPLAEDEVREMAKGSFLEHAPAVAVDSLRGDGIEELKALMQRELEKVHTDVSAQSDARVFRLPIDRVFSVRGFGTVVTGTPVTGAISKEQTVAAYPAARSGKVRGIEIFGQKAELARAGQRTAINLSGIERQELERGMTLAPPGVFTPSQMFDISLNLLPEAPFALKQRSPIRFHHGSGEFIGRIYLLEGSEIRPGQSRLAQVRLDSPTVACPGDRFILRAYSPVTTIGGGAILDNWPPKHRRKTLIHALPRLKELQHTPGSPALQSLPAFLEYFIHSKGHEGMDLPELVSRTGVQKEVILRTLQESDSIILAPQDPPLAVERAALDRLKQSLISFVEEFHTRNPLSAGVPREELKKRFLPQAGNAYFQFILQQMESERKIRLSASLAALHSRTLALTPEQQKIRGWIFKALEENPFSPPSLDELARKLPCPAETLGAVYYFLLQQGELIKVSEEIVIPAGQIGALKEQLSRRFSKGESFSVAEFKDHFKVSRKYAIPFLEFLDRQRITRRLGDRRVLL